MDRDHTPGSPAVVQRNIRAVADDRRSVEAQRSFADRACDAITSFAGSLPFVYLHAAALVVWVVVRPFPFVLLATFCSVEAIFLSTFVLISQNRERELAERRAHLDLQVNLLAEHEVTRLVHLVEGIAVRLGTATEGDPQLEELKREVEPNALLRELERQERLTEASFPGPRPRRGP